MRDRPERAAAAVGRLVEPVDADRVVRRRPAEPAAQVRRRLGVAAAARVDDERAAAAVRLEAEQVVVAVAAVAERPAVEDQEAGAGIPAAALHEVAAVGEARVAERGRSPRAAARADEAQLLVAEQLGGLDEQRPVVAAVGVRQRGDRPVRPRAVRRERAGAGEPLVEAGRRTRPRSGARSRARRRTSAARSRGSASRPRGGRRRGGSRWRGCGRARRRRSRAGRRGRARAARARRRAARTARACGGCAPARGWRGRARPARRGCRAAARRGPRSGASRCQA